MMKKNLFRYAKSLLLIGGFSVLLYSCSKKDIILDIAYPAQSVGIAEAAVATVGPGGNGIYSITPKTEGQAFRFVADTATRKFNVPLGVIRSGVNLSGVISLNMVANTDTIAKLITAGKFALGTELLPATTYTLPANVNIEDGSINATFTLPVDLNFLLTNITKKYAIAIALSNAKSEIINPKLSTVVIFIDPAQVLLPVSRFTNYVDNVTKTGNFTNLSANGVTYSWNFGDASPLETKVSPSHKYALSGSYPVTLTTNGIAGSGVPSVLTTTIVIP